MTPSQDAPTPSIRRVVGPDLPGDRLVHEATAVIGRLVAAGAALGWVDPPSFSHVRRMLRELAEADPHDACLVVATVDDHFAGFGYWRRYARPTHRPHADLEKIAVSPDHPRRGIGRGMLDELIGSAREARVEVLTLDFRGDNDRAESLYRSAGFVEYGRLKDFVAPDDRHRFDMVLHALDLRSPS